MKERLKPVLPWLLFSLFFIASVFLGRSVYHMKVELAYSEAIRNVTKFQDCFGYQPYAVDMVALRNSNIVNCQDITLLIKNHKQQVSLDNKIAIEEGE
jgi:hypothetical protein